MTNNIGLAVLISGEGRTLQNLIDRIADGSCNATIKVVISSNPNAYGLERAKRHGIQTAVISPRAFGEAKRFSYMITAELDKYAVDLILLAGLIHFYHIPRKYIGRVMNIHPGLIPAFCGKGLYGHLVHEAVIAHGVKVSGCTVHFANNQYDSGPIILQRVVQVLDDDTPETLAERVFKEECIAYPEAIRLFAEGRLKIVGRKVKILG